ncbi:MAG: hypothetical protein HFE68_08050, partial [Erysipelotrichaceae bacterium]|nr:hypothetical protein [Erysipelotrichaceae bacterium]
MWKKVAILCLALAGSLSAGIAFFSTHMAAAGNLDKLSEWDEVIVGIGGDGNEIVWTINKDNSGFYAMFHNAGMARVCNGNTNNIFTASGSGKEIAGCDFYTTESGKNHSPSYLLAKSYDDAYTNAIKGNDFEKKAVQLVSGTVGGFQHAYVPTIAQLLSTDLNINAMPGLFLLADNGYVKNNGNYKQNAVFFLASPDKSGTVYPSPTATTPYPVYIRYTWGYLATKGWLERETVLFSHLNNGDISYVLDSGIKKDTLVSNPRANVLKIRYTDPSYHVSFHDIKYKDVSIVG